MIIETLSTFPQLFDSYMNESIMKIAQEKNIIKYYSYNLRDWTHDLHHTTDDKPYGGGSGQLMMCQPIFDAYDDINNKFDVKPYVIFLSPCGAKYCDADANSLLDKNRLLFICGHYEGIDQRAYSLADKIYSIGDYVLTSGELASMVVIDSVVRKLPGVLGAKDGAKNESFANGLLEYPQYTRPADFRGMKVPKVLLSGNHELINKWREEQSMKTTKELRPDLLNKNE